MRVAVFGGTGQIGSQVCQALIACGCAVSSISRSGAPAAAEPWTKQVSWIKADMGSWDQAERTWQCAEGAASSALAGVDGGVDCVVSCIGSGDLLKASADGWDVTGYKWSDESLKFYAENYEPNVRVIAAAKEAGASRFVLVGASSEVEQGFGGPNPGLYTGKRSAYLAALEAFGSDSFACIAPTSVVNSKDDARMKMANSGFFGGLRAVNDVIGEIRSFGPDYANQARLAPPALTADVALAVAATATGKVEIEESVRKAGMTTLNLVIEREQYEIADTLRHCDGNAAITALARKAEAALLEENMRAL